MGSKRKLAPKILDYILENNPNCKYFYDLFGGGGAISFEALQRQQIEKVYYNEVNTGVVELVKKIQKDGISPEFYEWIDRETFYDLKNGSNWKAGLIKTCWSFGNNQISYMYGNNIDRLKKEAHNYLMLNGYDKTSKTRLKLLKQFKVDTEIQARFELQHLERLQHLEHLERVEHLECLDNLERIQHLEISNLSYENVKIKTPVNETIIYLDPPYNVKNSVSRYKKEKNYYNSFNYDSYYSYIFNSEYKIYTSSYESGLYEVDSYEHRCSLSSKVNNKVIEKLFCNREGDLK